MDGIQIDDDIPLPKDARHGRREVYPWKMLAKGQSFAYKTRNLGTARANAYYQGKRLGRRFYAGLHGPDGDEVRVWRTE